MAATHEYLCVVRLHVPIDYRNVSIVNFAWGQKVVPAGWLPAAERLELRHTYTQSNRYSKCLGFKIYITKDV